MTLLWFDLRLVQVGAVVLTTVRVVDTWGADYINPVTHQGLRARTVGGAVVAALHLYPPGRRPARS